jgi:hypothetical protein
MRANKISSQRENKNHLRNTNQGKTRSSSNLANELEPWQELTQSNTRKDFKHPNIHPSQNPQQREAPVRSVKSSGQTVHSLGARGEQLAAGQLLQRSFPISDSLHGFA